MSEAPPIAPSDQGAVGELRVCADLLARGYEVFRALSQARHSCDLVAISPAGRMLRIEVRTGTYKSPSTGHVSYMKNSSRQAYYRSNGYNRPSYREPDIYAVLWKGEIQRYEPELPE